MIGGGVVMIDKPCAVGGTPSMPPVFLLPASVNALERSICSMLPVETCINAFPFNRVSADPPVSYFTAQIKLLPPRAHWSVYGL